MKINTKELIMKTAWKHFSIYGYTDTNLEKICKDAGITRGPLYYYFKDKEDLYRQVLICETEKVGRAYDEILTGEGTIMEVVEKIIHLSTIYNPILQRANSNAADIPEIAETDRLNKRVLMSINDRFVQAQQDGQLKDDVDVTEMIYFLYTFALGIVTFDEKMNINSTDSFYDKELAVKIFFKSFKAQYLK